jgi:hypothetical protein
MPRALPFLAQGMEELSSPSLSRALTAQLPLARPRFARSTRTRSAERAIAMTGELKLYSHRCSIAPSIPMLNHMHRHLRLILLYGWHTSVEPEPAGAARPPEAVPSPPPAVVAAPPRVSSGRAMGTSRCAETPLVLCRLYFTTGGCPPRRRAAATATSRRRSWPHLLRPSQAKPRPPAGAREALEASPPLPQCRRRPPPLGDGRPA